MSPAASYNASNPGVDMGQAGANDPVFGNLYSQGMNDAQQENATQNDDMNNGFDNL